MPLVCPDFTSKHPYRLPFIFLIAAAGAASTASAIQAAVVDAAAIATAASMHKRTTNLVRLAIFLVPQQKALIVPKNSPQSMLQNGFHSGLAVSVQYGFAHFPRSPAATAAAVPAASESEQPLPLLPFF